MAKKYRPSALTYDARKYQVIGSREIWLREQKEKDKKYKKQQEKKSKEKSKIHHRYGKFKEKRSFGKAGDFDLDLQTTHLHVLEEKRTKRIKQGYYIRTIPDEKTDFWRLYIQKK